MFGDGTWLPNRTSQQVRRYERWLDRIDDKSQLVVIELGAGTAVPTVRYECQRRTRDSNAQLIRINPRECQTPMGGVSIECGALAAVQQISELM